MVENQNWTSEFARSFKNLRDLYSFLEWPFSSDLEEVAKLYPVFIPRNLAQKIKAEGPQGILAAQFLPHTIERDPDLQLKGKIDPIEDEKYFKAPQLIHRYSSRALFTPTTVCPVHCRYCFRKNELNHSHEIFQNDFLETLKYLKLHPEISEIIFTGGDPFTLSNEKLKKYLNAFSAIPSIKDIRFHTRYPVILPERFDDETCTLLEEASQGFRTVSIAIHANHQMEFDEINRRTIAKLAKLPIQLLSQSVLLRGVNDGEKSLIDLMNEFITLKVRPYYLHHPDLVKGGMHFYLPLQEGRKLYSALRKALPGWAIPHYVLDVPGGHGKITAFNPEELSYSGQLLSREGEKITYQEPDLFV